MAALTINAIAVTVRDRAKPTKIWDHIQIVIRVSFVFSFHDSSCFCLYLLFLAEFLLFE